MNKVLQSKVINHVLKFAESRKYPKDYLTTRIYNGKQYCTDGYIIFIFNSVVTDVPHVLLEEGEVPLEIRLLEDLNQEYDFKIHLKKPSLSHLKEHMKIVRARNKVSYERFNKTAFYSFGDTFPLVNERYLIDILEVMPKVGLYCKAKSNEETLTKSIVYGIDTDDNSCVLLPVIAPSKIPEDLINHYVDEAQDGIQPKRRRMGG